MAAKGVSVQELGLASVVIRGAHVSTGIPFGLSWARNPERAPRPGAIDWYQQGIEPVGTYVVEDAGYLPRGWVDGIADVRCPLVIWWNTSNSGVYDEHSWKARLARAFRARGRMLTAKLRRAGFDAVVTVRDGHTSEIVLLPGAHSAAITTVAAPKTRR